MRSLKMKLATLLAGVSAIGLVACSSEPAATLVGKKVDDYMLVDQSGMGHILRYDTQTPAIVLASYVNGDEGSRAAAKALEAAAAKHAGVLVHLINSSEKDTRESIAAEAKEAGITLPLLDDEFQLIGDSLGFSYAGEAVIVNPKTWDIVFHGPADKVDGALGEFITGGTIATAEYTEAKGTKLTFADRGQDFTKISYTKDVVPILMDKCVDCHQPNGIAPWHMTDYKMVKTFAPMMREAIRRDRMPPFDADRHYGVFDNDENLSAEETKTLVRWIEAGALSDIPEGGEDPLAVGVSARPDWPLGEPDLVVEIPPYDVPAAGIVDYQLPVVYNPSKEGKWLKSTTFKAGDRAGVHHILAGWMKDMPKSGRGFDWNISLGGYAVGAESQTAPDGWATWIPGGGAISFQMHYTPTGKAFTDHSKIGLYFQDEAPTFAKRQIIIADPSIEIAANAPRHHETAYVQFPADVQVYATQVHAHYRGYASKLTAIYPDGTEKVLLNMPHYDFNWQREYIFKDLIDLPAGTKLVADYWYDNSVNNKALFGANTKALTAPAKTVFWGDQSYQEMLFTGVQFRWKDETADKPRDDLQAQLERSIIFTMADDNRNGKLEMDELRVNAEEGAHNTTDGGEGGVAALHQQIKANFAQIDADQDGGVSTAEFGAMMQQMEAQARARGASGSPT